MTSLVGPGGIVWFQAGSGAMHHEFPAEEGGGLHGAQIFVKLSAKNKLHSAAHVLARRERCAGVAERGR